MDNQFDSPDALIASIMKAGSAMGQGWMGLVAGSAGGSPLGPNPAALAAAFPIDPARLAQLQADYAQRQAGLWMGMLGREAGGPSPAAAPDKGDKRFAAAEWRDNPYYDYLRQSYLLASGYFSELVESVQAEPHAKDRLRFAMKQLVERGLPGQLPGHQSRSAEEGHRNQGRKPDPGPREPDHRCGEGPHQPDRRVGVRSGPQPGDHTGLGGVRE